MDQLEYMQSRVDDQIAWYDKRSKLHQRCYLVLRVIEIAAAASIPFLVGYISNGDGEVRFTVGLLGVVIAVITAILGLYQFHEKWVDYRTACESLRHEKYLFLTQSPPYNIDEPFSLFVTRVEFLISRENSSWAQYIQPSKMPT